ncbi:MAG: VOC family protein [Sphingomonadales bacterium]|nr:MAG: VOC family protein [Sphingomonadales bacterium]
MLTSVKFVSIMVADQERALAFWTEKMGFALLTDQPMGPDKRWIELGVANSTTRVVLFKPDATEHDLVGRPFYGAFACDNVEATYRQLSARGVEFTEPPVTSAWGGFAKFKDPDGNIFVLSGR